MRPAVLAASAMGLIAATYGLVRMGYGLFLPFFAETFAISATVSGLIFSGTSVVFCLAAGIAYFQAGHRPRHVTIAAGATAAAGSVGIAVAGDVAVLGVSVVVAGAGAGFASPAMIKLIERNIRSTRQNSMNTVVNSGNGLGLAFAGMLALVLADSWRLAWALVAAATLAAMCSVLTSDSRTRVQTVPASTVGNRTGIRAFGLPAVGAYTLGAGSAAVWVQGRTLLQQVGQIDVRASAGAWVILGAGGAAAALLAGWLSRRTITVSWLITATGTGAATAFIGLFPQTISMAYAASALFGFAFNAATSVLIIWAGRIQADSSAAGTSLLFIALAAGQASGSALVGILIDQLGFSMAFSTAAGLCILSGLAGIGPTLGSENRRGE
ncbi:MFS transporter [Arthrobacter sp. H14]|uniref:MFS transporter n=1 Tax=Arthrobacter sp. H14 TaxID=1312959 RepID=UPI0004B69421|nr:MFS transporter [Arthrobacter sp. H14]